MCISAKVRGRVAAQRLRDELGEAWISSIVTMTTSTRETEKARTGLPEALSERLPKSLTLAGTPQLPRERWMDVLRGLAILLVLTLHATLVVEVYGIEPWAPLVEFNQILAPYRMPMLMLLSGLLLGKALRKGWRRYYQGKLDKVVYPLLVWTLISHMAIDPGHGWTEPWTYLGPYHLWFILFLAAYYGVAPVLEGFNTVVVVLACLAASALAPDGSKYGERFFVLMAFFFLGHALAKRPGLLERLTTPWAAMAALPVVVALSAYAVLWGEGVVYGPFLFLPVGCGIVVLVTAVRAATRHGRGEALAFLGRNSLVFYASHYPLTYLVVGATLDAGLPLPLIAAISLLTSLGVGTALVVMAAEWAPVRALFERPRLGKMSSLARNRRA